MKKYHDIIVLFIAGYLNARLKYDCKEYLHEDDKKL